jgi:hypothetical protein
MLGRSIACTFRPKHGTYSALDNACMLHTDQALVQVTLQGVSVVLWQPVLLCLCCLLWQWLKLVWLS